MKRYLTFSFDGHYPRGGMNDFRGDFDKLEDALASFANNKDDYHIIYDSERKEETFNSFHPNRRR